MGYYILIFLAVIVFLSLLLKLGNDKSKKRRIYNKNQKEIKRAGDLGEHICQNEIKGILRKDDVLLNNVCLDVYGKETEIDNLIINENGIFIVEVKNYNGTLYGNIDDYEWTKKKISPGGQVFTKEVKNPVKQIKRQTYLLSQYLKDNGVRIWIHPYAYFINSNSPVNDETVINDIDDLDYIIHKQQPKTYSHKTVNKVIGLLK